ncbi:MAG: HAD family hydrolase [Candidatus Peribacteria bacterium]|nr:MAG: HAD family hydrolase [Candidatus Peribacteria bacterium]
MKSGETLEKSKNIDIVVFDKTGTLTEGKPQVTDVIALETSQTKDHILTLGSTLSKNSHHPLSQAVTQYTDDLVDMIQIHDFQEIS